LQKKFLALWCLNPNSSFIPSSLKERLGDILKDVEICKDHKDATTSVISALLHEKEAPLAPLMEAAKIRGFLG
jgi:hypothetical protein